MEQRVPRRTWAGPHRAQHPRVLVEDNDAVLAISDFSVYTEAGFEVALCRGPEADGDGELKAECPLRRGEGCDLLDGADVVLHGLSLDLGIAPDIRQRYPDLPIIVKARRAGPEGRLEGAVPEGCIPLVYPCSVGAQVRALRKAAIGSPPT